MTCVRTRLLAVLLLAAFVLAAGRPTRLHRPGRADQDRIPGPAHRRLRPDRQGHGERHRAVPGRDRAPGRRPQAGADRRGHRGAAGHRPEQVAQAGRAGQGPCPHRRSARQRGLRAAALHRRRPDPGHLSGHRRRRHHPAQARQVDRPHGVDHQPADASVRRVGGEEHQVPQGGHHRDGLRVRLRDGGGLPARVRGAGRAGRAEDLDAAQHQRLRAVPLPDQARRRRRAGAVRRPPGAAVHEAVPGGRVHGKVPLLGGGTTTDESVLPQMGDEALGTVTALHYSQAIDTAQNQRFARAFEAKAGKISSYYSEATYTNMRWITEAIKAVGGKVEDRRGAAGRAAQGRDQGHRAGAAVRSTPTATPCRTSTSARSSGWAASCRTRSSRPSPPSASSGSTRPRSTSSSRSTAGTIRRASTASDRSADDRARSPCGWRRCRSRSAGCAPWTAWSSPCGRASGARSSAPTAPARPRCST